MIIVTHTGDQTGERNDLAPLSGQISECLGSGLPLTVTLVLCAAGFCLVGSGALLQVVFWVLAGGVGTLFPAAASKLYPEQRISSLTRNQTWQDIGAAAGPFLTGVLLAVFSLKRYILSPWCASWSLWLGFSYQATLGTNEEALGLLTNWYCLTLLGLCLARNYTREGRTFGLRYGEPLRIFSANLTARVGWWCLH